MTTTHHPMLLLTLSTIARGKGPKPIPGEEARQLARQALVSVGEKWPPQKCKYFKVERIDGQATLLPMEKEAAA